jgi:hypothetical protein
MAQILLFNLNGTIVTNVYESCRDFIEQREPGLLDIKELTPEVRKRRLRIADQVMQEGGYHPEPIFGLEDCLTALEEKGIKSGVLSNAGLVYMEKTLEMTGLAGRIDAIYALYDPRTEEYRAKDEALLKEVEAKEKEKGNIVLGYVSHKEKEAVLSAKVFGKGIHIIEFGIIDPEIHQTVIDVEGGKLFKQDFYYLEGLIRCGDIDQ